MRREGRQHGMVRTYRILPPPLNPSPEPRFATRFDSRPTAGLFTKVSSKPTNHSKFTGKCGTPRCKECHSYPASKSKDKAKGNRKSDYGLVTLRVLGVRPGLSATGILDYLGEDYMDGGDDDDDDDDDGNDDLQVNGEDGESGAVEMDGGDDGEYVPDDYDEEQEEEEEEDDKMSFCEVGIGWEQVEGEEGWCLVGEM